MSEPAIDNNLSYLFQWSKLWVMLTASTLNFEGLFWKFKDFESSSNVCSRYNDTKLIIFMGVF